MTILFDVLLRLARQVDEDAWESEATSGSATTLADTTNLEASDFWNGGSLFFKTGLMANRSAVITDFTTTTGVFAFSSPNIVTNPSIEVNTTGYGAMAHASIARSTAQYSDGAASLAITPEANFATGAYYTTPALSAGVARTFSVDVLDVAGQSFYLLVYDVHNLIATGATWTGTGAWGRHSLSFTPDESEAHTIYVVRASVNATDVFYIDAVQVVIGTEDEYLVTAAFDQYLALTPAWPKSGLVRAVNAALMRQTILTENETTAVVASQKDYTLPAGVRRVIQVWVGNDTDGWAQHNEWKERNGEITFYANEPSNTDYYIRLVYPANHGNVSADSDTINVQVNIDQLVFDALSELWGQRAERNDENPRAKDKQAFFYAEAEKIRLRGLKINPAPRYTGY